MKIINLIIDGIFLIAALMVLAALAGYVKLDENMFTLLAGIVAGFSIVFSIVQIADDIKSKPDKSGKKVKVNSIKNPFEK